MTRYAIKYMPDEMLDGRDFVLTSTRTGVTCYLRAGVRELSDAENAAVWEAAWAGFRALAGIEEMPAQRRAG